jgi:hypothetical protein
MAPVGSVEFWRQGCPIALGFRILLLYVSAALASFATWNKAHRSNELYAIPRLMMSYGIDS